MTDSDKLGTLNHIYKKYHSFSAIRGFPGTYEEAGVLMLESKAPSTGICTINWREQRSPYGDHNTYLSTACIKMQ